MRRKRTKRERQMLLNKKRFRHELRKRRKQDQGSWVYSVGNKLLYHPNILAMFRKPKDKKKEKRGKKK